MSAKNLVLSHTDINASFPSSVRNFTIRLPSYSTSGYSWFVLRNPSNPEPWQVRFQGRDTSSCPPGVVGCSGVEIYNLFVDCSVRSGTTITVPFVSLRPFDITGTLTQPINYVFKIHFN